MSMERDNEMIRDLLIRFRNEFNPGDSVIPNSEKEDYHIFLLLDSKFITAKPQHYFGQSFPEYMNLRITSAGHDFLEAAEDITIWEKAKKMLMDKGMNITTVPIDVLKEYLIMVAKQHLGID